MRQNEKHCEAKLKVCSKEIVRKTNEHTTAPIGCLEALKLCHSVKRHALDTKETAEQILTQKLENISEQAFILIPTIHSLCWGIHKYWQHMGNPPPVPLTREAIVIPDEYKVTTRRSFPVV